MLYFDWWPCLIFSLLTQVIQLAGRTVFYNEPLNGEAITNTLITMLYMAFNLLTIHLIITKWGLIYVESEIVREGNTMLLNDLAEGVIILEQESLE